MAKKIKTRIKTGKISPLEKNLIKKKASSTFKKLNKRIKAGKVSPIERSLIKKKK